MKKDLWLSIVLISFSIIMYIETLSFPSAPKWESFGSSFFPRIIIGILLGLSVIMLIRSLLVKKTEVKTSFKAFKAEYKLVLIIFAVTTVYIFILDKIGFLIATIIFMLVSQAILRGLKTKKDVALNMVISAVAPVFIYYIFTNFLNINLP